VSALENLKAQQASLGLAQQSLTDTEDRVEIGTQAPIIIVQAKAEVASNEAGVITADAAIQRAEDQLRALVLDPAAPDFWTTAIEPLDPGTFDERAVDVGAAVRNALDKRSDLRQAKNSLEQNNISLRYLKDQLLPDVSAQVNYSATGVGGSQLSPISGLNLGAARSVVGDYGFGSVVGDLLRSAYPTWTAGVQISYPLGTSAAKANFARSRLEYEQGQIELRNLELQVATQVRDVARSVQTNQQRVQSTRANRDLQEQKLAAEEQKLTAGSSSNFFVYQAQRDLAQARSQEIQAMTDYNKSVVDLEAVQETPLR
jgi:outer membrane protein TolC